MSINDHQRAGSRGARELRLTLLLTSVMMVVEFVGGRISGSLALLADAGHMLTDATALTLSLFAAWITTRPANVEKTYGYYRTEILAALANGIALWLLVAWIDVRAFTRLEHPLMVQSGPMLIVAILGLLVNVACGTILMQARGKSLNVQGAWLHVMSDAVGSVGVIIAGLLIRWYGWMSADAVASLLIGVLIAFNSWKLVSQSVNILLEAKPRHLHLRQVEEAMGHVSGVREVHDLHVWTITTGMEAMSGHVVIEDVSRSTEILSGLNAVLQERFGIAHTTFQLEPLAHPCEASH